VRRSRWLWAVAAVVLLSGTVAAVLWFAWLPRYRPQLLPGETYGIDVSAHQGSIDWGAVAGDDVTFAYLKATEGGDLVDASFEANSRESTAAGLRAGAYHFFTLCRSGEDQARNFLTSVTSQGPAASLELPPAVDLEFTGNCSARPDQATVASEVDAFVRAVEEALNTRVVFYVLDDFEDAYPTLARWDRQRWVRSVAVRPDDPWQIWQASAEAHVAGVDGAVDLNVGRLQPRSVDARDHVAP